MEVRVTTTNTPHAYQSQEIKPEVEAHVSLILGSDVEEQFNGEQHEYRQGDKPNCCEASKGFQRSEVHLSGKCTPKYVKLHIKQPSVV